MSTDVTERQAGSDLVIASNQTFWTDHQIAALRQLGVDRASNADLAVYFHQATRTGLDPFARQIYMINRKGKQTIQTGIDGFRLIGRRAVDKSGETLAIEETHWCGADGVWTDVWLSGEAPAAAKVAIIRDGGRFPAIALFGEYVARKADGEITQMWLDKPAGQLAKCCEALAWRKAFPQDLSGIYTTDEMAQSANPDAVSGGVTTTTVTRGRRGDRLADVVGGDDRPANVDDQGEIHDAEVVDEPGITPAQMTALGVLFRLLGCGGKNDHKDRLAAVQTALGDEGADLSSASDLTVSQASTVITRLQAQLDAANAAVVTGEAPEFAFPEEATR